MEDSELLATARTFAVTLKMQVEFLPAEAATEEEK